VPTVPQRSVGTAPLPGVRVNPNVPVAAFPGAINARPDLSGVQHVVNDLHQQAVDRADQVANLDNDNQLSAAASQIEQNALSLKGKNAMRALQQARADWEKQTAGIGVSAATDRQKMFLQARAAMRWQQLNETIEKHTAAEGERYDDDTTQAAIKNRVNDVTSNYADPNVVGSSISEAQAVLRDYASRKGWSPETTDQAVAETTSQMHSTVLRQFANARQLPQAVQYYNDHKDQFVGEDAAKASALASAAQIQNDGDEAARAILSGTADGQIDAGNIDVTRRPRVKNADGSVSTVRSISIEEDGKTVLIPTVVDGKVVSDDAAVAHYHKTGEHLGTFSNEKSANAYAQQLHEAQASMLTGEGTGRVEFTPSQAFARAEAIDDPNVRKIATEAVLQHFTRLNQLQNIERDNARAKVMQDLEASGGHLNTASPDWQTINGFPEGEQVLARQRQLLHPPPEPGDPDKYNDYIARLSISPETRQQVLNTNLADIVNDKTLSGGQKTSIIDRIRGAQHADHSAELADLRRQHADAVSERKQMQRDLKAAEKEGDDEATDNVRAQLFSAQQKEKALEGQVAISSRRDRFGASRATGTTSTTATPDAPKPAPFGLTPTKTLTPDMIRGLRQAGPLYGAYAEHLRGYGFFVPQVLPKLPEDEAPKKP
jgi:hypothetical protein